MTQDFGFGEKMLNFRNFVDILKIRHVAIAETLEFSLNIDPEFFASIIVFTKIITGHKYACLVVTGIWLCIRRAKKQRQQTSIEKDAHITLFPNKNSLFAYQLDYF